jgi:hypothetical protein
MSKLAGDTGWFKSSFSSADSDNCVEVRIAQKDVAVRDSKNTDGPVLHVSADSWHVLLTAFRCG